MRDYDGGPVHEVVTFSDPPASKPGEVFRVIERPPIPEMDNFVEKYLGEEERFEHERLAVATETKEWWKQLGWRSN